MKKLIVLFIVMCSFIPLSWAMDGCNQHLSPDEFRAKQKAYITEKAGLTKEEAAKFFPVYFELQDRKKQLNDEAWKAIPISPATGHRSLYRKHCLHCRKSSVWYST